MREIKYRGKVNGQWRYVTPDNHYLWPKFWAVVDKETAGQCTGRKDKNDKEIYEGDIALLESGIEHFAVEYDDARFVFRQRGQHAIIALNLIAEKYVEIIGNIYDTPLQAEGEK